MNTRASKPESGKRESLRTSGRQVAESGCKVLVALLAILAFTFALWSAFAAYVQSTTIEADGEITGKQEIIEFGRADNWAREFNVAFRYHAGREAQWTSASHSVDRARYERLSAGDLVRVRYSRYELLRQIEGMGAFIDGTPALSRLPHGFTRRDALNLGALLLLAASGLGAFALSSRALALVSLLSLGALSPDTMLAYFALVVFPFLFWAWRKNPSQGYGWLLIVACACTMAITYFRVPRAEPLPSGAQKSARAVVTRLKKVTNIWDVSSPGSASGRGRSGQPIRTPFYLVDLQFTPDGAVTPVHAVDRVDIDATAPLQKGASVGIVYSLSDPHAAQIAVARRNFSRALFGEIAILTLLCCAVITFVAVPVIALFNRIWDKVAQRKSHPGSPMYLSGAAPDDGKG